MRHMMLKYRSAQRLCRLPLGSCSVLSSPRPFKLRDNCPGEPSAVASLFQAQRICSNLICSQQARVWVSDGVVESLNHNALFTEAIRTTASWRQGVLKLQPFCVTSPRTYWRTGKYCLPACKVVTTSCLLANWQVAYPSCKLASSTNLLTLRCYAS